MKQDLIKEGKNDFCQFIQLKCYLKNIKFCAKIKKKNAT